MSGRRVVAALAKHIVIEHGSVEEFGTPERAAIAVHWSATPVVSRSLRRLVQELTANGYRTVVVSACEAPGPLEWGGTLPSSTLVIRKPNVGYDFGSWAVGLATVPAVAKATYAILANDSVVGPMRPLAPLLAQFESSPADVWGLTDNYQFYHHLQSYFLGFRGGILADGPLRRFFAGVRIERNKWNIIERNEIALSRLVRSEGYVMRVAFTASDVVAPTDNPVIVGWRALIENGFPFVKRELVWDPSVTHDADLVGPEVEAVFGERIEEWV